MKNLYSHYDEPPELTDDQSSSDEDSEYKKSSSDDDKNNKKTKRKRKPLTDNQKEKDRLRQLKETLNLMDIKIKYHIIIISFIYQ